MVSMYLLIPLSLMLFVIGIWAVRYAVRSNQFEDLDNESQRVILDDRQERRQALGGNPATPKVDTASTKINNNQSDTSNIPQASSEDKSTDGK